MNAIHEDDATDEAPGWAAIDAALERTYGAVEPFGHIGTQVPYALGGPDPLDGISVYARDTPEPHWLLVGYGMSELYAKESADAEVSGYGFEFTIRVVRRDGDDPPMWAAVMLQQLARYVVAQRPFAPGHTIHVASGTFGTADTELAALAFLVDPDLGAIATPFGSLTFLQIAGLTEDEYAAAQGGNAPGVLSRIAARSTPLHLVDPARTTLG
ncbi:suppressor of fused domain protein [Yinghuangia soli]|uniref:Suppressor of fused domain protein n=1 Tax=Yinghuangia soli TaxID=2908204 RepID=A0AA41PYE1_9ACTN|nr:suppressor of fused domain protein [Yinghuangia soli]MCF2527109.1 suppressor of fused domain protein [Yinghuangia soli]